MADISGPQYDDYRAAIEACVGKWVTSNEGGKLTAVTKKRKADDGAVEIELALCAGDLCMQKRFRVLPSLEVSEGWAAAEAAATAKGSGTSLKAATLKAAMLATKDGKTLVPAAEALAGKIVALYFSASWCPPCKLFTPVLKAAYEAANKAGKRFEVVWVSSDYDAASQQAYMDAKHGDWLQVPHDDPLRQELKVKYGAFASKEQQLWPSVTRNPAGIPSLVLVGPDGAQLEYDGYPAIDQNGAKAVDAWATHAWPV